MERDFIYYFDKKTFRRYTLGEIQTDFNMSFVIDGTKDSNKVMVISFDPQEIEPMTIVWHGRTNTWWVATHDKVERYVNENDTFIYTHTLDLLGAIELFNARDLTDCGFNDNTYTVNEFITRLFNLSTFEYNLVFGNVNTNFLNQKVDFIKTFENYTLLAALREFLDAYNYCAKLTFEQTYSSGNIIIDHAVLNIIPKTGDYSLEQHDESEFYGVKETRTIDKDSYGTCVVSNAENVISSSHKTYPIIGSVKMSSTNYYIVEGTDLKDAVIRLPSKVYKGNWIKIVFPLQMQVIVSGNISRTFTYSYERTIVSFNNMIDYFADRILQETGSQETVDMFLSYIDDTLKDKLDLASVITLYNDNDINAYTGEIIKGKNVPYLAQLYFGSTQKPVTFTDKETKGCLKDIKQGIAWERGSNLITGLDMFDGGEELSFFVAYSTDYQGNDVRFIDFTYQGNRVLFTVVSPQRLKYVYSGSSTLASQLKKLSFIVDYNPIADLKIKVDNDRDKLDIQLYNQNGRLTDNVALSKLLNSYAKEISSDSITKYGTYYDYNEVPKVGSIVWFGNDPYVINNVSLTFNQNEKTDNDFGYFIDAEFTMSKYFATKSLMISPNTNIRDYGIPQNYNVKRKQLYRDYYELSYIRQSGSNADTPYLDPSNIFTFYFEPTVLIDFIGVIKLGYQNQVESSYYWYYQLDATNYYLNKMIYVVIDFNDNNIIGYGSQNVFSGFDISRILQGFTDALNTPISYVDENGNVKSIDLLLCTANQLTTIYDEYQQNNQGGNYEGTLYNYSVFIPKEIFDGALETHKIRITENNYKKDAIEVPVFEYVCQIADSDDVLIGDNILNNHDGFIYFYSYVMADQGQTFTQNNAIDTSRISYSTKYNAVKFYYISSVYGKYLDFEIYSQCTYDSTNNTMTFTGNPQTFTLGRDYAIFRHAKNFKTNEEIVELMFIVKKLPQAGLNTNERVRLTINHYKLN